MITETPPEAPPVPRQSLPRASLVSRILTLLKGHFELAKLEGRYEAAYVAKRMTAYALSAFLGLTVFILLQIAFIHGLMALKLPLGMACLVLATIYMVVIWVLVGRAGERIASAGRPFQGSRDEWRRSKDWIFKRFS